MSHWQVTNLPHDLFNKPLSVPRKLQSEVPQAREVLPKGIVRRDLTNHAGRVNARKPAGRDDQIKRFMVLATDWMTTEIRQRLGSARTKMSLMPSR